MLRDIGGDLARYAGTLEGRSRLAAVASVVLLSRGFQLVVMFRLCRWLRSFRLGRPLASVLSYVAALVFSCELNPGARIGSGLLLPHPLGVVIGEGALVGVNVTLFQHVTIGSHGRRGGTREYPCLGDNVVVYAGASITGGVSIGDGAVIGAHSLVRTNVAAGDVVAGVPAVSISASVHA